MNRYLFIARVTVKDGERAFLLRNGRYERVLEPGRHALLDPRHELAVELHNVVRAEFSAERWAVLKTARPDMAEALFEAVETRADELAIVSLDGRPLHMLAPLARPIRTCPGNANFLGRHCSSTSGRLSKSHYAKPNDTKRHQTKETVFSC